MNNCSKYVCRSWVVAPAMCPALCLDMWVVAPTLGTIWVAHAMHAYIWSEFQLEKGQQIWVGVASHAPG